MFIYVNGLKIQGEGGSTSFFAEFCEGDYMEVVKKKLGVGNTPFWCFITFIAFLFTSFEKFGGRVFTFIPPLPPPPFKCASMVTLDIFVTSRCFVMSRYFVSFRSGVPTCPPKLKYIYTPRLKTQQKSIEMDSQSMIDRY